jgi:8-hydroxy-5-deazaflavin:NADPH oxidoreductase
VRVVRIAIIGTGRMGSGFATAFARAGHEVVLGSRDAAAAAARTGELGAAGVSSYADAVRGADVVMVAVPGTALEETLPLLGDLNGKVVVDCTNRFVDGRLEGTPRAYAHELIQAAAPEARVVKAWNHVGSGRLTAPEVGGQAPSVLVAGDDEGAKGLVASLAREIGFDPVDVGSAKAARSLTMLAAALSGLALGPERPLRIL